MIRKVIHTGIGSSKKVSYTVFIAAKLAMSVKKTPTRTTFFMLDPASSSTAERFLKHCAWRIDQAFASTNEERVFRLM